VRVWSCPKTRDYSSSDSGWTLSTQTTSSTTEWIAWLSVCRVLGRRPAPVLSEPERRSVQLPSQRMRFCSLLHPLSESTMTSLIASDPGMAARRTGIQLKSIQSVVVAIRYLTREGRGSVGKPSWSQSVIPHSQDRIPYLRARRSTSHKLL
jgi:hypothetical protein